MGVLEKKGAAQRLQFLMSRSRVDNHQPVASGADADAEETTDARFGCIDGIAAAGAMVCEQSAGGASAASVMPAEVAFSPSVVGDEAHQYNRMDAAVGDGQRSAWPSGIEVAYDDAQQQELPRAGVCGALGGGGDQEVEGGKAVRKMAPARERAEKGQQLPKHLDSHVQFLSCGSVPEEANPAFWSNFGTLANGGLEIRESKVKKVVGDYALGRGLFARREYAVDEIITVYGGELITREEANLRKEAHESLYGRYLLRISDSDFVVDGSQFASGIPDTPSGPDGCFFPVETKATQWMQGCAAMANHDPTNLNAYISFETLNVPSEAASLYPRIPTLKAQRGICPGEEILFNYGSPMPFTTKLDKERELVKGTADEGEEEKAAAEKNRKKAEHEVASKKSKPDKQKEMLRSYSTKSVACPSTGILQNRLLAVSEIREGLRVRVFWSRSMAGRLEKFQYGIVAHVGEAALSRWSHSPLTCAFKVDYPPQHGDPDGSDYAHDLEKTYVELATDEDWTLHVVRYGEWATDESWMLPIVKPGADDDKKGIEGLKPSGHRVITLKPLTAAQLEKVAEALGDGNPNQIIADLEQIT